MQKQMRGVGRGKGITISPLCTKNATLFTVSGYYERAAWTRTLLCFVALTFGPIGLISALLCFCRTHKLKHCLSILIGGETVVTLHSLFYFFLFLFVVTQICNKSLSSAHCHSFHVFLYPIPFVTVCNKSLLRFFACLSFCSSSNVLTSGWFSKLFSNWSL